MTSIEHEKKDKNGRPVAPVPKPDPGRPQRPEVNVPKPEQPKQTPGKGRTLPSSG